MFADAMDSMLFVCLSTKTGANELRFCFMIGDSFGFDLVESIWQTLNEIILFDVCRLRCAKPALDFNQTGYY